MKDFLGYMKLFNEMDKETIQKIHDDISGKGKNPSLKHIFGDKQRIAFPVSEAPLGKILNNLRDKGYEINIKNGMARKDIKSVLVPNDKNKEKELLDRGFTKSGGVMIAPKGLKGNWTSLGKVISKEFGENELKKFYSIVGHRNLTDMVHDESKEIKYYIVLTRNPIDVLRMSDHEGIDSCHSKGGDYFYCAMTEAKNEGAVAYLVNKDDLSKVNLNDEEIFKDEERNVEGITPLGRIRVRKLYNNEHGYEFALPSYSIYGGNVEGFYETLRNFLYEKQKHLFLDEKKGLDPADLDPSYFERYGGLYVDEEVGPMMTRFFNNGVTYRGDAQYAGEDEERDQLTIAKEEIEAEYNKYRPFGENIHIEYNVDYNNNGEIVVTQKTEISVLFKGVVLNKNAIDKNEEEIQHRSTNHDTGVSEYDIHGDLKEDIDHDCVEPLIDMGFASASPYTYFLLFLNEKTNNFSFEITIENNEGDNEMSVDNFRSYMREIKGFSRSYHDMAPLILEKLEEFGLVEKHHDAKTNPLNKKGQYFSLSTNDTYVYITANSQIDVGNLDLSVNTMSGFSNIMIANELIHGSPQTTIDQSNQMIIINKMSTLSSKIHYAADAFDYIGSTFINNAAVKHAPNKIDFQIAILPKITTKNYRSTGLDQTKPTIIKTVEEVVFKIFMIRIPYLQHDPKVLEDAEKMFLHLNQGGEYLKLINLIRRSLIKSSKEIESNRNVNEHMVSITFIPGSN